MTDQASGPDSLRRSSISHGYIKLYRDPENLQTLYWERGWDQAEIADFYGVNQSTISRAMSRAGIETRPSVDEQAKDGDGS